MFFTVGLITWLFSLANAGFCRDGCFQTCLRLYDLVPKNTYNTLADFMRHLKERREMSGALSTTFLIDSAVDPNTYLWEVQRTLAAASATVIIQEEDETCNPIISGQYFERNEENVVAWGYATHQCKSRCKSAENIMGLSARPETSEQEDVNMGCVLAKNIINQKSCASEPGMLLIFDNSKDQFTNNTDCEDFSPIITESIYTSSWLSMYWPVQWLYSCLQHFCCDDIATRSGSADDEDSDDIAVVYDDGINPPRYAEVNGATQPPTSRIAPVLSRSSEKKVQKQLNKNLKLIQKGMDKATEMGIDLRGWTP